ncbi:MAG: ABC transporter ATP-binding protein [Oscillospiraceae bacterium]
MSEKKVLLEVKNLKKYYSKNLYFNTTKHVNKAVDDVSFSVYEGETFGLVGESGCGKTTIGKMIVKLIEPDSGEIVFDGLNFSEIKAKDSLALRRNVQMVFQDPHSALDPKSTLFKTINEALKTHKLCKTKIEAVAKIERLISLVGLNSSQLQKYPSEFSGGQCQRISIAKALAVNPRLIVCDEPVSALDVSIQAQIINTIVELQHRLKLTYIFISHNLAVVKYISDKIGVMYLGKIVELGTADDIYMRHQHPYTQTLLDAILDLKHLAKPQSSIDDENSLNKTTAYNGCNFYSRCKFATPRCFEEAPKLKEVTAGHFVACHLI